MVTTETKLAVQSEIGGWRVALPLLLHTLLAMMKGHKVSEDLAWAVVYMAPTLEPSEIAAFTAVIEQQQRRIFSLRIFKTLVK